MKFARAAWLVLAGLLIGLAAGVVWTLLQPDRHRAEARVLIRGEARGLVPAVKALAESSLLEQNLAQTLRLGETPRISATGGTGGVITLTTEGGSSERARQIDGEAAIVLGRLVTTRFGPGAETTVLDPAHTVEQTSPTASRNLLLAGLIGLAAGVTIAVGRGSRRARERSAGADLAAEQRLLHRIDAVAKRELALARRAGELAQREAALGHGEMDLAHREAAVKHGEGDIAEREATVEYGEGKLAEREAAVEHGEAELEARSQEVPVEPEPEPELEPEPQPEAVPEHETEPWVATRRGWSLDELEELVRRQDADPAQSEEWMSYLFYLREHAAADGSLSRSFDGLVNEVFGPLLR